MIYVIGSGPAGISAAVALVNKGLNVTMLDAGLELEPERRNVVQRLRYLEKKMWDDASIKMIKEKMIPNSRGVEFKSVYGSDYPYRGMDHYQPVILKCAKMIRSLAKGGLSTVWGGAILPYRQKDIQDWPITVKDLSQHYKAVLSFLAPSGKKDGLSSILPLYGDNYQTFCMCNQASGFLKDLESNKKVLQTEGIFFGHSRLAVKFNPDKRDQGCAYCGLCLYGCPYEKIFSTTSTLDWLLSKKTFQYVKGILVEKLIMANGEVKIFAKSLTNSEDIEFCASRVFLATGVLSSTRILLESLEAYDHTLKIKHSEHFQVPMIRYKGNRNVTTEDMHTLSQLFIEIIDESLSKNTVHMQMYAFNDLYLQVIKRAIGPLVSIFRIPIEEILGRLFIIKGYLHSNISSHVLVRLEPGNNGRLFLEGQPNEEAGKCVRKILTKLLKNRSYFKAVTVPQMVIIAKPGTGNHSGGSFPMRKKPSAFETDELGRPYSFENVHVVDSTISPSVPATTITLTVMANAHRIASSAC